MRYGAAYPGRIRIVAFDTTDATINGPNDSIAIDPSRISATNNDPAIGALYAAVMPAAAPQATSSRNCDTLNFARRPTTEATVAERWTIEPSRPSEPPLATDTSEERLRATLWPTGTRPSPMAIASM